MHSRILTGIAILAVLLLVLVVLLAVQNYVLRSNYEFMLLNALDYKAPVVVQPDIQPPPVYVLPAPPLPFLHPIKPRKMRAHTC